MIGVTIDIICDSGDAIGWIVEVDFFVTRLKVGNVMCLLLSYSGTFGWPSVIISLRMYWLWLCHLWMKISSLFRSRFINVLTIRSVATCRSVNAVIIYLMKPILDSRCVEKSSCDNQVLFFWKITMISSSPCFMDYKGLVEFMTWMTKNCRKGALR